MPQPDSRATPAADLLRARRFTGPLALITGSGLGDVVDALDPVDAISYEQIPGFPVSTVAGHAGRLVRATPLGASGPNLLVLQGRFHYYEGYAMEELTLPIHVLRALGVETLVVTNAAGGLNADYTPGDLVLITDHINFMGSNPLIGWSDGTNDRFVDLGNAYSPRLRAMARDAAPPGARLHDGVLMAFTGPSYETRAEIRLARLAGADLASMSTVPEVIVARLLGIEVLGISCVTNVAAADDAPAPESVDHEEVVEASKRASAALATILRGVVTGACGGGV
jgi:purine-nucleoside phosphorylase